MHRLIRDCGNKQRNRDWLERVNQVFRERQMTRLVLVGGAEHLVGEFAPDHSLLELLVIDGFKVSPVTHPREISAQRPR
jgi:uncharacterized protein YbaP (TraB family)